MKTPSRLSASSVNKSPDENSSRAARRGCHSSQAKKIIEAASVFLQDENFCDCACRFDVGEVYLRGECVEEIHQIENAFEVAQDI